MFRKGNKLHSIFNGSCPKCHRESMYVNSNPYIFSDTLKMHDRCSHCHTKYKIEPSFFYGSMYVSYAVGIIFAIVAFIVSFGIFNLEKGGALLSIIGTLIVFLPVILRLSRNIWINFFMHYDKELVRNTQ